MIGRVDLLETDDAIQHWKADGLDLTPLLTPAAEAATRRRASTARMTQDHGLDQALDNAADRRWPSRRSSSGEKVRIELPIVNTNRTVGTILSHEVAKRWGEELLPDDTIHIKFNGSAGQSFGAFLAKGVTLELEGDANDYVGKGLSGGRIIIYPPKDSTLRAGGQHPRRQRRACTARPSGEAFFRGRAAERFCVRNSGARAVIEGVGDHGCEYMTGGRAVILGPTGRNFAAGMSRRHRLRLGPRATTSSPSCNLGMVELEECRDDDDIAELLELIELHHELHRLDRRRADCSTDWPEVLQAVRQGHADRLQTRADANEANDGTTKRRISQACRRMRRQAAISPTSIDDDRLQTIQQIEQRRSKQSWENQPASKNSRARPFRIAIRCERASDFLEIFTAAGREPPAHAGRALHGLRRAVLPIEHAAARSTT